MGLTQRLIFFTVTFALVFLLQYLVYRTFSKYLIRKGIELRKVKMVSRLPFLIFNIPYLLILAKSLNLYIPGQTINEVIIQPFYIFQSAVIFTGLYLLAGKIIKLPFIIFDFLLKRMNFVREKYTEIRSRKKVVKFDESRRKFITASTTVVTGYAFVGAGVGRIQKDDYKIEKKTISIPGLPEEHKGLRGVLISDIHSGPYMEYELMKEYVDVINDINADIIFIPGDLTNSQRNEASPFAKAFRDLKAKYGVYATYGNHDYFSDIEYINDVMKNETGIKVLRNESELVDVNGKPFCIMGTEDTRDSGGKANPVVLKYIEDTISSAQEKIMLQNLETEKIPKVLLTHKPYLFDEASGMDFNLMLSGHTHGGQVVFLKFGDLNVSFASSVHKYINGLYQNNGKYLYVSRGIGTVGLPIRFNCPPEITILNFV